MLGICTKTDLVMDQRR